MNSCNLVGRLTKDPEPRQTQNGNTSLSFTVAVDRGDKDRNTDFITCQAWNKTAQFIAQYFHKGDPIAVTGKIQTRSYEKDGRTVYVTEVWTSEVGFVPRQTQASNAPTEPDDGLNSISF